jgi:hypothetical protein
MDDAASTASDTMIVPSVDVKYLRDPTGNGEPTLAYTPSSPRSRSHSYSPSRRPSHPLPSMPQAEVTIPSKVYSPAPAPPAPRRTVPKSLQPARVAFPVFLQESTQFTQLLEEFQAMRKELVAIRTDMGTIKSNTNWNVCTAVMMVLLFLVLVAVTVLVGLQVHHTLDDVNPDLKNSLIYANALMSDFGRQNVSEWLAVTMESIALTLNSANRLMEKGVLTTTMHWNAEASSLVPLDDSP